MAKLLYLFLFLSVANLGVSAQQIVQLKSGEKMNGKVQSLNNGVLEFYYKGATKKIPVNDIYSIVFGEKGESGGGEVLSKFAGEAGEKQVNVGAYAVRYKVADRIITKPPRIDNLTQEKGTVVVEVTVNKYGSVIKAVPGAPGSTTNSDYLKTKAKQAAESTLFDKVPTAPLEQHGYMVIAF